MIIKVIENWDGLRGNIVDTIERKTITRKRRNSIKKDYLVSYKGKLQHVFYLPSSYKELEGNCIEI